MTASDTADFTASLGCLIDPAMAGLAAQLAEVRGVTSDERGVLLDALRESLRGTLHRKLTRLLVLDLNAARVTGRLTAPTSAGRWDEFIAMTRTEAYWAEVAGHYPPVPGRVATIVGNRCAAALTLARRYAADKAYLGIGDLRNASFGDGDSHRGGQAVALLRGTGGTTVYKPRSVRVDAVLEAFLRALPTELRIPSVLARRDDGGDYGWAEYVEHTYCAGDAELGRFYTGVGHLLAVMRLLGGSDLHSENMIAVGPVPVVVDCETLFTPAIPAKPSGLGGAVDRAGDLIDGTVLRTGLLPGRGVALGWRGVDASAVGGLPGQQPMGERPVLVGAGTDEAYIGLETFDPGVAQNHPSPQPALGEHWDRVVEGFDEITAALRELDKKGRLEGLLAPFADCPIRVVVRSTEGYAEIERMLWHPVSLHEPEPALDRAAQILADMAHSVPGAPDDPDVIAAELADLQDGDIPFFATTPATGQLAGPRGTRWHPVKDLVADSLLRWREADLGLERRVIRSALVSAYLNEGWLPADASLRPASVSTDDLGMRRRAVIRKIIERTVDEAVHGDDGTVTWISPILNPTGWAVQALSPDFYGGAPGVAIVVAAYRREVAAGRADPVAGLDDLLDGLLRTMELTEIKVDDDLASEFDVRPPPLGSQIGLGGQIWSWLVLERLGVTVAEERPRNLAKHIPAALAVDDEFSLMIGASGAVVPLLDLAERTGEERYVDLARQLGDRLVETAKEVPLPWGGVGAVWPTPRWPAGLGGLVHGSTGIGWALARLFLHTGQTRYADRAREAFAFEDLLWDPAEQAWRDLREPSRCSAAWCHGTVGIGLLAHDLRVRGFERPDLAPVAARTTFDVALGWNHTLCHGDLGAWELFDLAPPPGADLGLFEAELVTAIEEHGPVTGLARNAFTPGLLPGAGGIAYQLLRFDRSAGLPSVLVPGGAR
ncbi:type 2 lanthipeptide synthetase LanM family protein [Hamadaea tsunoensis]|uniref:type 2 lanthipeptide synthetase LanM family protein n=1 Tax=Hamadaea tsunoensis TaxID=53368 RepID=UPI0003F6B4A6|nr:type 2 lanthipeptide synthetase LanM family protein [Hamadaea tsunoensis]